MDEEGSKGIKDRSPKPIMLSTVIIFDIQGQEEVGDEIPESWHSPVMCVVFCVACLT